MLRRYAKARKQNVKGEEVEICTEKGSRTIAMNHALEVSVVEVNEAEEDSDAPIFPCMVEHPLNLGNGFVDVFSTEVASGVRSISCRCMLTQRSATEVHLHPEQQASTASMAGCQVE